MTGLLTKILSGINGFVHNYGWAIVLFTIFIRLLLLPLDIKNRQGMRKMQKIQPELNKLQKKYANDKVKLQQKQSELMRREKYNPMAGCLPLLIQMPILFAMFGAMRQIANEQTVQQVFDFLQGKEPVYEGWLWVKNLWMADSLFVSIVPDMRTIQMIPLNIWTDLFQKLTPESQEVIMSSITALGGTLDFATAEGLKNSLPFIEQALIAVPSYQAAMAVMPGWSNLNFILFSVSVYMQHNGLLILPILAGASQMLMTRFTPGMSQPAGQDGQQQPGTNNFMKYFFPIFSVYICLTSNAGFALYWVVSNLIATASNIGINAYFDRTEKAVAHLEGENSVR